MSRRVGLLGGTFDPFHSGHLEAARTLVAAAGLDGLWLVPSARPPHRPAPVAPAEDRFDMTVAGATGLPRVTVLRLEIDRPGPSYTYDTVVELLGPQGARIPGSWQPEDAFSIALLVGADAARELPSWHRWEELRDLVDLIVFERQGIVSLTAAERRRIRLQRDVLGLDLPGVSATWVREELAAGRMPEQIPPAVRELILERGLYGIRSRAGRSGDNTGK